MCISVGTTDNATMQARGEALAFEQIAKQSARPRRRFLGIAKVNNRLPLRPENFAMLAGILCQHTATGCRDFKAAHYMAVSIGAANQAKVHFRRRRQGTNDLWWLYPQSGCPKGRIPFPIATSNRDWWSVTHEFPQKGPPVSIGAPDEKNIISGSIAALHRGRK